MALDGQPRSASVEALTDVECAIVPIDELRRRITSDPDFTMELIRTLIGRSRNTTTFSRRLALDSAYQRCSRNSSRANTWITKTAGSRCCVRCRRNGRPGRRVIASGLA